MSFCARSTIFTVSGEANATNRTNIRMYVKTGTAVSATAHFSSFSVAFLRNRISKKPNNA